MKPNSFSNLVRLNAQLDRPKPIQVLAEISEAIRSITNPGRCVRLSSRTHLTSCDLLILIGLLTYCWDKGVKLSNPSGLLRAKSIQFPQHSRRCALSPKICFQMDSSRNWLLSHFMADSSGKRCSKPNRVNRVFLGGDKILKTAIVKCPRLLRTFLLVHEPLEAPQQGMENSFW
jgi:hypothetical protein